MFLNTPGRSSRSRDSLSVGSLGDDDASGYSPNHGDSVGSNDFARGSDSPQTTIKRPSVIVDLTQKEGEALRSTSAKKARTSGMSASPAVSPVPQGGQEDHDDLSAGSSNLTGRSESSGTGDVTGAARHLSPIDLTDEKDPSPPVFTAPTEVKDPTLVLRYGMFKAKILSVSPDYLSSRYLGSSSSVGDLVHIYRDRRQGSQAVLVMSSTGRCIGALEPVSAAALTPVMDHSVLSAQIQIQGVIPTYADVLNATLPVIVSLSGPANRALAVQAHLARWNIIMSGSSSAASLDSRNASPEDDVVYLGSRKIPNLYSGQFVQSKQQGTYDVTKRQVEEIFKAIKNSEELPETEPDGRLISQLYSHQKQALTFLLRRESRHQLGDQFSVLTPFYQPLESANGITYYNLLTETVSDSLPDEMMGGILADEMGLGKTISMIALLLSRPDTIPAPVNGNIYPSRSTLIICPLSIVTNWEEQIAAHTVEGSLSVYIYHGPSRIMQPEFLARFDVVITTYNVLGLEYSKEIKSMKSAGGDVRASSSWRSPLQGIAWRRIILDEAHIIKEPNTIQSRAASMLTAQSRWCLSGTPLQNRLDDLYSLIRFLRLPPFDDRTWWSRTITKDPKGVRRLQSLLKALTLRRIKSQKINGNPIINLPSRTDSVWFVELDERERKHYDRVFDGGRAMFQSLLDTGQVLKNYAHILEIFLRLRQICTHWYMCKESAEAPKNQVALGITTGEPSLKDETDQTFSKKEARGLYEILAEFGDDQCGACFEDLSFLAGSADGNYVVKAISSAYVTTCRHLVCDVCLLKNGTPEYNKSCPVCQMTLQSADYYLVAASPDSEQPNGLFGSSSQQLDDALTQLHMEDSIEPSTKVKALISDLLRIRKAEEDAQYIKADPMVGSSIASEANETAASSRTKSVVFSQWTQMLDLLETHCRVVDISCTRLDGKMNRAKRTESLQRFKNDPSISVLLISLRAGGVGLNLTCANRVYIMDPWWNPSVEAQAIDRVHRLGQSKPIETIRIFVKNSIEENILELQKRKAELARTALLDGVNSDNALSTTNAIGGRKETREQQQKMRMADLKFLFR